MINKLFTIEAVGGPAYDAFISYSHEADGRLAPEMQHGLERFARPWNRVRALRVFRDETGLSVNPALWPAIEAALSDARFLVLLASPRSASSAWVTREVEYWLNNKPVENILLVLSEGELAWNDKTGDFDRTLSTSLPSALFGRFAAEPRHLDMRWARDEGHFDLAHSRFRSAVADLAAPLHGVPKDMLESEDLLQHRKARRFRRLAMTLVSALAIVASLASFVAVQQANRAQSALEVSEAGRRTADSQRLAVQARSLVNTELETALLLGVEGMRLEESSATRGGLLAALSASPSLQQFTFNSGEPPVFLDLSPGRRTIASSDLGGVVSFLDAETLKPTGAQIDAELGVVTPSFSPDESFIAVTGDEGTRVYDLRTETPTGPIWPEQGIAEWMEFAPDGDIFVTSTNLGFVQLRSMPQGAPIGEPIQVSPHRATGVSFHPNGDLFAVGTREGTVVFIDTESGRPIGEPLVASGEVSTYDVAFSPDGMLLAASTEDGAVVFWDFETRQRSGETLRGHEAIVYDIEFSPSGRSLATAGDDGNAFVWDVGTGKVTAALSGHGQFLLDVRFLDERNLITTSDGELARWDLDSATLGLRRVDHDNGTASVAVTSDGLLAATGGAQDGQVHIWDVSTAKRVGEAIIAPHELVNALAFHPNETRIAYVTSADPSGRRQPANSVVVVADFSSGQEIDRLQLGAVGIYSLDFHPATGELAIAGSNGRVTLWNPGRSDSPTELIAGVDPLYPVKFSPDGSLLLSGSVAGVLTAWNQSGGVEWTRRLGGNINSISFSPDGHLVSAGGSAALALLDSATGIDDGGQISAVAGELYGVAFHPRKGQLAAWGTVGLVARIDLDRRELDGAFAGHSGASVSGGGYGPEGESIITAGHAGEIIFWFNVADQWQVQACRLAGRNLSRAEWDRYMSGEYTKTCSNWPPGE